MFNNQGNSKPEASHSENGDMASEWEELVELDDVQLATIVGGWTWDGAGARGRMGSFTWYFDLGVGGEYRKFDYREWKDWFF